MRATSLGYALLALVIVVGLTVPAAAVSTPDGTSPTDTSAEVAAQETATGSSVNVTVGQQLSTVVAVSSGEVQTDFENTAFELSVERASDEEQAEAIADRAEALRDRATDIRDDHREAVEAYQEGEIGRSEYAQRLATLNARATNVRDSHEQLRERAQSVSALELQAAGMNRSALRTSVDSLSGVSGPGVAALLNQFTGEAEGEIELDTTDGLSIETRNDDGERSREFDRPRDDNPNITVTQSAALETGRAALSSPENGTWTLTETKVKYVEGYYEFTFTLRGTQARTGETEIRVDGSSGEVFRLEAETEVRDEEDNGVEGDEPEGDDEPDGAPEAGDELTMTVSEGTPGPNETITVTVLAGGDTAGNATVYLNDRAVGTTAADGRVTVTLPAAGEVELTARSGDAEGELEFEFEAEGGDNEAIRNLNVDASLADGTVTTAVSYNGSGVANATVYADDRTVGTTGPDGVVTFSIDTNETEDLELEVVKGAFEAELAYTVQDGMLTLTEEAHEGDGDKTEEEAEEEQEAEDEQKEQDEEEEPEETETPDKDDEDTEEPETPEPTETPEEDRG